MKIFVFLILLLGKPTDIDIAIALARAEAEAVVPEKTKPKVIDYVSARKLAIETNTPLIVWIGQSAKSVPGCLTYQINSIPGAPSVGVIIGKPRNGELWRIADLSGNPSIQKILDTIKEAKEQVKGFGYTKEQPPQQYQTQPVYQTQPTFYRGSSGGC